MTRVLVTGGNGFLGSGVVAALAELAALAAGPTPEPLESSAPSRAAHGAHSRDVVSSSVDSAAGVDTASGIEAASDAAAHGRHAAPPIELVVSADLREPKHPLGTVIYEICDVTNATAVDALIARYRIDTVVHLASIVNPGTSTTREMERRIDVDGSRNVMNGCLTNGVKRLIVSSSGAAYGYHADNPEWLRENDALRGNDEFAYSQHKRLVEEMLAEARTQHPELEQVIFRIGTILGENVDNQITALFEKKRLLRVAGSESPFVFIWNTDVVAAMVRAVTGGPAGIYNVAGDGALPVTELAAMLGKRVLTLPAWLLRAALWLGHLVGATPHTAARVVFLRYRPVLANDRLKLDFGYTPRYTSREAFEAWLAARDRQGRPVHVPPRGVTN